MNVNANCHWDIMLIEIQQEKIQDFPLLCTNQHYGTDSIVRDEMGNLLLKECNLMRKGIQMME